MAEFRLVTPLQEALVRFTKLTHEIPDEELRRILDGGAYGTGIRGWLRGCAIRWAKRDLDYFREQSSLPKHN